MRLDKKRLIIILVAAMLVILACEVTSNIDPGDERLVEPSQNMIENWQDFFGDFGGSPDLSAPTIQTFYPTGNVDHTTGKLEYSIKISNWFYEYVGVFEVEPLGCGENGQPKFRTRGLIQTFKREFALQRQMLDTIFLRPNTLITVAGSNNLEYYGQYNELLRLAYTEEIWAPKVLTPDLNQYFFTSPIDLTGQAIPGMCLELTLNNIKVDHVQVHGNGNWNFDAIRLGSGANDVVISALNVDPRTVRSFEKNFQTYAPPQPYDRNNWPVVDPDPRVMPNLWRNIRNEDIPIKSIPGSRDPEVTIAILHQFQVDRSVTSHRYGFGGSDANYWRCNIYAGDVMQAMSIPFPTKDQVNCCGGGNMWVGPEFMYEFMSGSKGGIANIETIWGEWGKWETVYDSHAESAGNYDLLLTHLRLGKPALVSRPDHIAVLRTDNLPDRLGPDNVKDLYVAQAGSIRSNSITIKQAFASSSNHALRIFIHE